MSENFEMVAKTFQGLEGVLSDELKELGAQDVQQGKRMVSFTGDKEMMYRANFCLHTALRVLKPIYKFRSADADDLYEKVKRFDWSTIMQATDTFAIDSTVYSESFRHSRFVTYRVKDAIADYFMEAEGRRPSIRLNAPDLRLDVHISGDEVTLSLDSSGEPLYKRGWRVAQTDAPINEVLAAGIIKLSGWHGQCNLVDPMCGSGTFLIEAALIAANINPGVYRNDFAFQRWSDYDPELYSKIYNDDSGEREFDYKIYGSDIAVQAVAIAEANVKSAGLGKMIEVRQQDLRELEEAPEKGYVITNPPYGERLRPDDIAGLYESIGQKLKKVFRGYQAWLITYDKELTSLIGLHPSVTYPLLNGDLECELREYVIFDGSYKDMKRAGGTLRNEGFRASDKDRGARRPFKETYGADGDAESHGDDGKPRRRFDRDKKGRTTSSRASRAASTVIRKAVSTATTSSRASRAASTATATSVTAAASNAARSATSATRVCSTAMPSSTARSLPGKCCSTVSPRWARMPRCPSCAAAARAGNATTAAMRTATRLLPATSSELGQ